jgi:hypothetical protein
VYAAPGESCSGGVSSCSVGVCAGDGASAMCPAILPRGAPCDPNDRTKTCDLYDVCSSGTCQGSATNVCK